MSGVINKVKDALTGEKNTSEARAANQGSSGEFAVYLLLFTPD